MYVRYNSELTIWSVLENLIFIDSAKFYSHKFKPYSNMQQPFKVM